MTKLEKSVRHCMSYYGQALRARKYIYRGFAGAIPDNCRGVIHYFSAKIKDGICTNINGYVFGQAMYEEDYYRKNIDITEPVGKLAAHHPEYSWDEMINDICDVIEKEIEKGRLIV